MLKYTYSHWDGSQDLYRPDADSLMKELEKRLMTEGDLKSALEKMQHGGLSDDRGRNLPSLQDLIQKLRQRRRERLERYNLGSIMDDIKKRLEHIIEAEKQGISRNLDETRQKMIADSGDLPPQLREKLLQDMETRASRNMEKMENLPDDAGGRIKELSQYDFMDDEARSEFQELMDMLKKNAMSSIARDMMQQFQSLDSRALAAARHFLEALNQMLEARQRGEDPRFEDFMEEFGRFFGDNPPKDLDELIERLQQQISQARSLLESLSVEDREQLRDLLDSMFDEATRYEAGKLSANLEALSPGWYQPSNFQFSGEEPLSYQEAMKIMEELHKMDNLEEQIRNSQYSRTLDEIDRKLMEELLGEESARDLENMRSVTRLLEEAGYIIYQDGKYELTPRGIRKIGQKALQTIFAQLRKDRGIGHQLDSRGQGGERLDETKQYEFGDDLNLHIQRTVMNAIHRRRSVPVKMQVDDFEVFRTEAVTRSATVLMLDLSLSMPMRGNFEAAKRVAVALDTLIRTQYPRDSLYIVGFSSYGRQVKKDDLAVMGWDEFDPYTNLQHGLFVARKLLTKEICTNKQIILVSDGEPTAHFEGGYLYFRFPPSPRTIQATMNEVRNCTRKGIIINTFMMESGRYFGTFITRMARLNKGRIFHTNANNLGRYMLVDFMANKGKVVR